MTKYTNKFALSFMLLGLLHCNAPRGPKQVEFRGETGPPTLLSAETMDVDSDGKIDHYRLTFDKNINDTTFPGYISDAAQGNSTTRWLVAGYNNVRFDPTVSGDTKNDKVIYVAFDESSELDTGATPDVTTTSEPMLEGVNKEKIAATVTEADRVAPVLVDVITPLNSSLYLRFSERVYSSATGGDTLAAGAFNYTNVAAGGATAISGVAEADGSDGVILLASDSAVVAGDIGQDTVGLAANSVFDAAGNSASGSRSISGPPRFVTDGSVNAIAEASGTLYIGGASSRLGPYTGSGVFLNKTDGQMALMLTERVNGTISAAAPDGSGGYYIGGTFTKIGNTTRNRLARFNANGSLHPWNPDANGDVLALAVSGSVVYAGGSFTTIGGQTRNRIAGIDSSTGVATSWDANASSTVRAIAVSGTTIYAGGSFATIGGLSRSYIAALDNTTGAAISAWNASCNNPVYAITIDGSTVYAGGQFTSIGGQTRNRIAALDATTGTANLTWNPNATSGIVHTIAVSGSTIFAGGTFTTIGGQARNRIAALDNSAGNAVAGWDAAANGTAVYASVVSGTNICVAGDFTSIGGQARGRLACLDTTAGTANSWNPGAAAAARTLAMANSTVFAGGDFGMVNGIVRNNIAAITTSSGYPTTWNPNSDNTINTIAIDGSTVYVGGTFTNIGGAARNRIAAIDSSGNATTWNPDANNTVRTIEVISGSAVFAGGDFTSIGGLTQNYLAKLNTTTGAGIVGWNPAPTGVVRALKRLGSTLYVGGSFGSVGLATRFRLGAVGTSSQNATYWNPYLTYIGAPASAYVTSLAILGTTDPDIFAGGFYDTVGGGSSSCSVGPTYSRINIGSFQDLASDMANQDGCTGGFAPNPTSGSASVNAIAISGSNVYFGGNFTSAASQTRNNIAATTLGGASIAWDPNANGSVMALVVSGTTVYAGGAFTSIGGMPVSRFAAIDATSGLLVGY